MTTDFKQNLTLTLTLVYKELSQQRAADSEYDTNLIKVNNL